MQIFFAFNLSLNSSGGFLFAKMNKRDYINRCFSKTNLSQTPKKIRAQIDSGEIKNFNAGGKLLMFGEVEHFVKP